MTYGFHRVIIKALTPNGVHVHYASLFVSRGRKRILRGYIPCRSNLYKVIVHLFFGSRFSKDTWSSITKEDLKILTMMLHKEKKYFLWRKTLRIIEDKGTEEGRKLLKKEAQMFYFLKEVSGEKVLE